MVANQTKGQTISDQSAVTLALLRVQQPRSDQPRIVATATARCRADLLRAHAVLLRVHPPGRLSCRAKICSALLASATLCLQSEERTSLRPEGKRNAPYL